MRTWIAPRRAGPEPARLEVERSRGIEIETARRSGGGLACGCQAPVRRHFEEVLKGVYPDEPIRPST